MDGIFHMSPVTGSGSLPVEKEVLAFKTLDSNGRIVPNFDYLDTIELPDDPARIVDALIEMDATLTDWVRLWCSYQDDAIAMEIIANGGLRQSKLSGSATEHPHDIASLKVMMAVSWKVYAMNRELDDYSALCWTDYIEDVIVWCRGCEIAEELSDLLDDMEADLPIIRRMRLRSAESGGSFLDMDDDIEEYYSEGSSLVLYMPDNSIIHCPKPIRSTSPGEVSPPERLEAAVALIPDIEQRIPRHEGYEEQSEVDWRRLEADINLAANQCQSAWAEKQKTNRSRVAHLEAMELMLAYSHKEGIPEWLV